LIAATTGFGKAKIASNVRLTAGRKTSRYEAPPLTTRSRSTPAEKIDPGAVMTTAFAGERAQSSNAFVNASLNSRSNAFALPWTIVRMVTSLRWAMSIIASDPASSRSARL
jgi:hypothetical protein